MRLRKDLVVLECTCCNELVVVNNDEFVELFRQGEIITDDEILLAEILDEILVDDEEDYDCEFCEFDCDECGLK